MKPRLLAVICLLFLFPALIKSQQIFSLSGGISMPQTVCKTDNPHFSLQENFYNSFTISFAYTPYQNKHFGLGVSGDYVNTIVNMEITSGGLGGGYHTDTVAYRLGFINIAMLPGAQWGKKVQFLLQAGPYFGFLTNTNADANGKIQNIDAGIELILGLRFYFRPQLGILAKNINSYGFVNKYRDAGNLKSFNFNFLVGIFYSIGIK